MTAHSLDTDGPAAGGHATHPDGAGRAGMVRHVRIGRQAVYDAKRQLVSYELLFRNEVDLGHAEVAGEQAT